MESPRLTGSYYTSRQIAQYLTAWAVRGRDDRLLEPSFGDGVFLDAAAERFAQLGNTHPFITGVELQSQVFARYAQRAAAGFTGLCQDFMEVSGGPFTAVVGNPPYVSLRNLDGASREKTLARMAEYHVKMLNSGSLWMPFTVHSTQLLEPGGRLAFVLPFELTYVKYAYPLWTFLGDHYGRLRLLRVHEDFFPDVDVEAVLLLAEERGGCTDTVELEVYDSVDALLSATVAGRAHIEISDILRREKPFTFALLSEEQKRLLIALRAENTTVPLLDACKFNIGYVCADKEFFHPGPETVSRFALPEESLVPCVRSSRELSAGVGAYTDVRVQGSRLFFPEKLSPADRAYIQYGEETGVNLRYKCRRRKPWYLTPDVMRPDLILTVFGDAPKLIVNRGGCAVSNSLLAGTITGDVTPEQVLCMWYNSLTLLSIERNVHALGGGVLVLIPGETDLLEVVRPIPAEAAAAIAARLDACLREEGLEAAYRLGDELVLSRQLGVTDEQIEQIRAAAATLKSWRVPKYRSKRARAYP